MKATCLVSVRRVRNKNSPALVFPDSVKVALASFSFKLLILLRNKLPLGTVAPAAEPPLPTVAIADVSEI